MPLMRIELLNGLFSGMVLFLVTAGVMKLVPQKMWCRIKFISRTT